MDKNQTTGPAFFIAGTGRWVWDGCRWAGGFPTEQAARQAYELDVTGRNATTGRLKSKTWALIDALAWPNS